MQGLSAAECLDNIARGKEVVVIEEEAIGEVYGDVNFGKLEVVDVVVALPFYMWWPRVSLKMHNGGRIYRGWITEEMPDAYCRYAKMMVESNPEGTIWIDGRDFPLQVVSSEEAYQIMTDSVDTDFVYDPVIENDKHGARRNYHQAIEVSGEIVGNPKWYAELEKRIAGTLPDVQGKTVLDVGAAEGTFSLAAAHRGASLVVSCERNAERVEILRKLRDKAKQPITTVCLDMNETLPPALTKYDVTLMLNVIRHLKNPEWVLSNLLKMSDMLICETRTTDGPTQLGNPPHQAFSVDWMMRVGEKLGFNLEARPPVIESTDKRAMFVFTR